VFSASIGPVRKGTSGASAPVIATIDDNAWTPVRYPGAVIDPDTGAWISDAEVAEIPYTALASTPDRITARLVVRRVKDARYRDALFPVWRYHPFFTNTDLPVDAADITHQGRDFAGFGDACCDRICDATRRRPAIRKILGSVRKNRDASASWLRECANSWLRECAN
jgi:hypothetical protein